MKRVGARWANRDLSDKFRTWRDAQVEDKNQARAEAIMRRVGGRFRNKDLSLNFCEWARNYKTGIMEMVTCDCHVIVSCYGVKWRRVGGG